MYKGISLLMFKLGCLYKKGIEKIIYILELEKELKTILKDQSIVQEQVKQM